MYKVCSLVFGRWLMLIIGIIFIVMLRDDDNDSVILNTIR